MSDLDKYRKLLNHQPDEVNDELAEFIQQSSNAKIPAGKSKEAIWDQIEEEIGEEKKLVNIWMYVGIAASLLLAASFVFYFNSQESPSQLLSFQTNLGESTTVELPDGSKVVLNANSEISYEEKWGRSLSLQGEAFFEVVEGGKFTVNTQVGIVEVLGTSFNVFARDSIFEVACKTGKVRVDIPYKSYSEAITPGEMVRLEADTVQKGALTQDLIGKWQAGEFYFSDQKLSNVLQELERQFDVSIEIGDSTDYIFSGYFTNKNVEDALDMVCLPLGLQYTKIDQKSYSISELN